MTSENVDRPCQDLQRNHKEAHLGIRAGNTDRSNALDILGTAFADGFITLDEFEERSQAAAVAKSRDELRGLLADIPALPVEAESAAIGQVGAGIADARPVDAGVVKQPKSQIAVEHELNDLMRRGQLIKRIDGTVWAVATVLFFLSMFVFNIDFGWVTFPIAGVVTWGVHELLDFDDDDEEIFDSLAEEQRKQRAERLRIAVEKRKELGQ